MAVISWVEQQIELMKARELVPPGSERHWHQFFLYTVLIKISRGDAPPGVFEDESDPEPLPMPEPVENYVMNAMKAAFQLVHENGDLLAWWPEEVRVAAAGHVRSRVASLGNAKARPSIQEIISLGSVADRLQLR